MTDSYDHFSYPLFALRHIFFIYTKVIIIAGKIFNIHFRIDVFLNTLLTDWNISCEYFFYRGLSKVHENKITNNCFK